MCRRGAWLELQLRRANRCRFFEARCTIILWCDGSRVNSWRKQYQVLARKWRPQQFDDVCGQEHVTTTLKNAIEQNRLAHAYLFVGPRASARPPPRASSQGAYKGPTPTPLRQMRQLPLEITEGRSLDVLEIDGASNNA